MYRKITTYRTPQSNLPNDLLVMPKAHLVIFCFFGRKKNVLWIERYPFDDIYNVFLRLLPAENYEWSARFNILTNSLVYEIDITWSSAIKPMGGVCDVTYVSQGLVCTKGPNCISYRVLSLCPKIINIMWSTSLSISLHFVLCCVLLWSSTVLF